MTNVHAIEADFLRELAELEAESIGWQRLEEGMYLHQGSQVNVVEIVGLAHAQMIDMNVVWVR